MAFEFGRLQKDVRNLRRFLKQAPKHATPKQVHSLRTATRRFEAAIQALRLGSDASMQRLLRKLAKLRRRAGKVRDLDVLTGYVAGLKIDEEQDCRVQLLEYLGAEHGRRSQQLHSFTIQHGQSLARRLERVEKYLKTSQDKGSASQTEPPKSMLSELRLQRELIAPIRLTKNNLHPYRLQVKELRYRLQMENDAADQAEQALIETLGQVKDAIGEWHDWQELLMIARDHLAHGSRCKLIPLFQRTTQQKFKHAVAIANAGRQRIQPSSAVKRQQLK